MSNKIKFLNKVKKTYAFTLAEVLITLGIIGVVAAMTMPVLTASTRKSEYSARLKKYYSTMQQAVLLYNQQHNMLPEDWPMPENSYSSLKSFWDTRFAPYFKNVISTEEGTSGKLLIKFSDGSSMEMSKSGVVNIYYDLNGDNPPNQNGRDIYVFLLNKGVFTPYNWTLDIGEDKDDLYNEDEDGNKFTTDMNDRDNVLKLCKKAGSFCSQLLILDNWEYQNDYPYKI